MHDEVNEAIRDNFMELYLATHNGTLINLLLRAVKLAPKSRIPDEHPGAELILTMMLGMEIPKAKFFNYFQVP
jgi:hypothetical protein